MGSFQKLVHKSGWWSVAPGRPPRPLTIRYQILGMRCRKCINHTGKNGWRYLGYHMVRECPGRVERVPNLLKSIAKATWGACPSRSNLFGCQDPRIWHDQRYKHYIIWMFPKIGVFSPKWMKTLLKWMIWGYHNFRKHPYITHTQSMGCLMPIFSFKKGGRDLGGQWTVYERPASEDKNRKDMNNYYISVLKCIAMWDILWSLCHGHFTLWVFP